MLCCDVLPPPLPRFNVNVSYLEIYNESFRDLLAKPSWDDGGKLELRETAKGVVIQGLTQLTAKSAADVAGMIAKGRANRTVGSTDANTHSSRSHSVLSITVEGTNELTRERTRSTFHVVDLAGSERQSKTQA